MTTADLLRIFRAYLESICESPRDVAVAMKYFEVDPEHVEETVRLLTGVDCPAEIEAA